MDDLKVSTRQISFPIQGMFCASCAVKIENALTPVNGVIRAYVNYASERALVVYEPSRVRLQTILDAVRQQGFGVPLEDELAVTVAKREQRHRGGDEDWKQFRIPLFVGTLSAFALVGLYLGILSALQSPRHAFEQLSQDAVWVGLVASGFGTQIGLYVYLRQIIHAMQLAGATAIMGAGTGTSTLGMVACCAHHITDVAPLLGLTGASGISGIVTFLGEWKIPFIVFGLAVNAIGIVWSLRTIRRERVHLKQMQDNAALATVTVCH